MTPNNQQPTNQPTSRPKTEAEKKERKKYKMGAVLARFSIREVAARVAESRATAQDRRKVQRVAWSFRVLFIIGAILYAAHAILAFVFGWVTAEFLAPVLVDGVSFYSILFFITASLSLVLSFMDYTTMNWTLFGFVVFGSILWFLAQGVVSVVYLSIWGFRPPFHEFWVTLDVFVIFSIGFNLISAILGVLFFTYARRLRHLSHDDLWSLMGNREIPRGGRAPRSSAVDREPLMPPDGNDTVISASRIGPSIAGPSAGGSKKRGSRRGGRKKRRAKRSTTPNW